MTTLIVKQTGGDYASLNAAIAAADSGDVISIEGTWTVDDTLECYVPIDLDNVTIEIGDSDAAHPGYWDTSVNHYRLVTSGDTHCLVLGGVGTIVDGLAIRQNGSGSSSEGIRIGNGGTNTIRNCLLTSGRNGEDQDGVYCRYLQDAIINIENTVIWNWTRRGVGFDQTGSRSEGTTTFNVNSSTIMANGYPGDNLSAGIGIYVSVAESETKTIQVNVHNSIVMDSYGDDDAFDIAQQAGFGTGRLDYSKIQIDVSNSIDSDGSIGATGVNDNGGNLNNRTSTSNASPGTGDWVCFEDPTMGYNFTLISSGENDAQDMHSTETAEGLTIPSVDIVGMARPQGVNYDCGAFEIPPVAFTAQGLRVFPEVGTPTAQVYHALGATGLLVEPEVGIPSVIPTHGLEADGIRTGTPVVGSPTMTQDYILIPKGTLAGPETGSPSLGQTHILETDGIETPPPTVGEPSVVAGFLFHAQGIETPPPTVGEPALTHIHALEPIGLEVTPVVGVPEAGGPTAHYLFLVEGIEAGVPEVGSSEIGQTHILRTKGIRTGTPEVGSPSDGTTPEGMEIRWVTGSLKFCPVIERILLVPTIYKPQVIFSTDLEE